MPSSPEADRAAGAGDRAPPARCRSAAGRPGFAGLARVVVGQQVSVASADAIWARCVAVFPEMTPEAIGRARLPRFRKAGLSAPKIRTLRAVAAACRDGLDLDGLAALPAEEAHARLTAIKGIGPWTADIYLLFCLGHPDIFPAGDLALRVAVADAFGLGAPAAAEELAAMAETLVAVAERRGHPLLGLLRRPQEEPQAAAMTERRPPAVGIGRAIRQGARRQPNIRDTA